MTALVLALAGVVVSALALGRSDEAATLAASAQSAGEAPAPGAAVTGTATQADPIAAGTTEPATGETTDAPAAPEASASPGDISPSAQFQVAYEGEHLRVRSPGCGSSGTYVDLDKPPRVGVAYEISELSYAGCEPGQISTELQFAEVTGPTATPSDCLETIRTDPGRSPTAARRGMTLCFITSQNAASAQGITQKLVFVTVDSITRDDDTGVLNVTVKAWNVPQ
ncbi:hypothetical protein ACQPZX_30245 [Actinoplanes sp. CA-142083]|uniref:hypothetical protein n=1 Tax=Actinoplanes sp. CA-142083 TaxID=3239903 RepID=UPI003D8B46A5